MVRMPGLSPRVRGNRGVAFNVVPKDGSIPACAGEPRAAVSLAPKCRVYPRVCGGTLGTLADQPLGGGLSPRVRGNLHHRQPSQRQRRSIPACAGEPTSWGPKATTGRVYPRVCGGTTLGSTVISTRPGLSPRVRGNPGQVHFRGGIHGSIPACAGEPHPVGRVSSNPLGLSPRVRGNPATSLSPLVSGGSIPACAGEPWGDSSILRDAMVYPRVCGGTAPGVPSVPSMPGLSPRVRGNQIRLRLHPIGQGSIPACAGEPRSTTMVP